MQTILIVDDEESIRSNFHAFLTEEGYKALTAGGYDEAMRIISEKPLAAASQARHTHGATHRAAPTARLS